MSCLKREVDVFGFRTAIVLIVTTLVAGLILPQSDALGQGRNEVIAITGQAVPDGNGTFDFFSLPALNDSGQVAFRANLTGTSGDDDNVGIFSGSGGGITQIARAGQAAPDANGTFSSFTTPAINDLGQAAFRAFLTGTSGDDDNVGIFRGSGGGITQIARAGQAAPDANGTFSSFLAPQLNDTGQAAFRATLTGTAGGNNDDTGIFRGSGNGITQIARAGQAAPDANGIFSNFSANHAFNDSGQVAFRAGLTGTSGGGDDNVGIFRGSGGGITQIVRRGQAAPDANGTFDFFGSSPALNNVGQVGFWAILAGTSGNESEGIFRGNGGGLTQIARRGQATPDANGTFSSFNNPVLNDSGQAAFRAILTGTNGGDSDNRGIFRGSGGGITQIARTGQAAPDANGTFSSLDGSPVLNDSGQVAFFASLIGTSGGNSDDRGIFTGDGIDLIQVVREGDSLAGGVVTQVSLNAVGRDSLNEHGQIAYLVTLDNGSDEVIGRWTPDLRWRDSSSGNWDTASNWTLGLNPAHVHDVLIDPATNLTVTGPAADTTVRSLQIGGGNGMATLALQEGVSLFVNGGIVTVESNGVLTGSGTIVGDVHALGIISPGASAGTLAIDGNVLLGSSATTLIELGGLGSDQFDRLVVTANLHLDGDLLVSLIDGHSLGMNQHYLIADVGGELFGQFNTLDEGALVGSFAGHDLFISYTGGNGNSVVLFTAIPEPSSSMVLAIAVIALLNLRFRRHGSAGFLA